MLVPWRKSYNKPRQHIKKQRHHFASKGPYSQSYGFSSSDVQILALDCKEGWAPNNWCFKTVCWRRLLRVPWTVRRSNQPILKENNPEYSLKGLMLRLKLQYFVKSWLIGKDLDTGKDWEEEEKEATEDEKVGWHCRLSGHEFEQTLGDSEGQGRLVCCSLWVAKTQTWLSVHWTKQIGNTAANSVDLLRVESRLSCTQTYYRKD